MIYAEISFFIPYKSNRAHDVNPARNILGFVMIALHIHSHNEIHNVCGRGEKNQGQPYIHKNKLRGNDDISSPAAVNPYFPERLECFFI